MDSNVQMSYTPKYSFTSLAIIGSLLLHSSLAYAFILADTHVNLGEKKIQMIQMDLIAPKKVREPVKQEPVKQELVKEIPIKQVSPPKPPKKIIKKPKIIKKAPIKVVKPITKVLPKVVEKSEPKVLKQDSIEHKVVAVSQKSTQQVLPKVPTPQPLYVKKTNEFLSAYLFEVRQKIQNNLYYPYRAKKMGLEGKAIVSFLIKKSGEIDKKSLKIVHSSGNKILDKSAIESILQAAPFGKALQTDLSISIPVVFKLRT